MTDKEKEAISVKVVLLIVASVLVYMGLGRIVFNPRIAYTLQGAWLLIMGAYCLLILIEWGDGEKGD